MPPPLLPFQSCDSWIVVKENPDRKKNNFQPVFTCLKSAFDIIDITYKRFKSNFIENSLMKNSLCEKLFGVSPIQDGLFRGCSRMEGAKKAPLPKICHTYPTMIKFGTVIPYLEKIEKIYESRDTPREFRWHQYFFTGNQQILLYQEI